MTETLASTRLWPELPTVDPAITVSLLVTVRLPRTAEAVQHVLAPTLALLHARCGNAFEVIVSPFGEGDIDGDLGSEIRKLTPLRMNEARGLALRRAFLAARGRTFITLHPKQPCDPSFFIRALDELARGADLVRANRRLADTRFRIPVSVLPIVHRRHRLGIAFNRVIRMLMPIDTSDTHAGNMAMSRRMATAVFALQRVSGFLFDVELSLIAHTHSYRQTDLPERLYIPEEKSVRRVTREMWSIIRGVPSMWMSYIRGRYDLPPRPAAITADDWGISPAVNRGIADLVAQGVIRRVSMLADGAHLAVHLDELLALERSGMVQLGLHFNLTHGADAPSPQQFLKRWLAARGAAKRTLVERVRSELTSQLATLRAAGATPVYLDGHHHIHLTPGLLRAIAPVLRDEQIREVRIPYDPALWRGRKAVLNVLALLSRPAAFRFGFRQRSCFYPQAADFADPGRFRARLADEPEAEVIVHPAVADDFARYGVDDPYSAGRRDEYDALRLLGVAMHAAPLIESSAIPHSD
jgi:predicted glycoside hydrolase/deacetylase ChbG (UPF0249 family)